MIIYVYLQNTIHCMPGHENDKLISDDMTKAYKIFNKKMNDRDNRYFSLIKITSRDFAINLKQNLLMNAQCP